MKNGYFPSSDYPHLGEWKYHINTKNTLKSLSININRYDVKPSKVTLWGRERQPMHFFIWVSFLKALRSIILFVNYPSLEYPVGTALPSCWEIRDARLLSLFDFLNLQNMIILNYYQRALFIHVHFSIFQQSILQDKISRNKYIKGSCKTSN